MKPNYIDVVLSETVLKLIPHSITPNEVTVARFVSVPFVLYCIVSGYFKTAVILFLLSAFSDAVDGAMARTRHQVTDWGKIFDPLADKLLIGSVAALLVAQHISVYLVVIIIALELLLIVNGYYKKYVEHKIVQAQISGKIKMFLQCLGIGLLFAGIIFVGASWLFTAATITLYLSVFFAAISLFVYRSI